MTTPFHDSPLTEEQRYELSLMIGRALGEIRLAGQNGKLEQARDLADAFHNFPAALYWKTGTFSWEFLRQELMRYAEKYPQGPHGLQNRYVEHLDEIRPDPQKNQSPRLDDAIALAVKSHHGDVDKVGSPYILHPLNVMRRLKTEVDRIVGVLHDVVEDSVGKPHQVTLEDLHHMGYSEEIVTALDCVTKRKDETYEDFILRAKQNPIAQRVKLADLEDNLDKSRRPLPMTEHDMARLAKYRKAVKILKG